MATNAPITINAAPAQRRVAIARAYYVRSARDLVFATTPAETRRAAEVRRAAAALLPCFNLRLVSGGVA